ncbi:MAG: hypothetical protein JXA66_01505 [Oligoflexia bacterium]|nr:hypothetical protein [Oligoflexia bacterium]
MDYFICNVCGHLAFNDAPDKCPVCEAAKEEFKQNNKIFVESEEKSPEASVKHVPYVMIKKECGLIKDSSCVDAVIKIGEVTHPMETKHFIMFIDCYLDNRFATRIHLSPNGIFAAGCLHIKDQNAKKLTVVENCNIHGYWMKEVNL